MSENKAMAVGTALKHTDGRQIFELHHSIMAEARTQSADKKPSNKKIQNSADDGNQDPLPLFQDSIVRQKWRILSKVEAWPGTGYWLPQCVDYSSAPDSVMHDLVRVIDSKPDFRWDHSYSSHDIAGWIENAEWEPESDIVPGVNALVCADPRYDQKAAVGLEIGMIRSGSVGINVQLVKSHPDMDTDEFVTKQGKIVANEKIRWIPIKITKCDHMAIVPYGSGADPNAGPREHTSNSVIANTTTGKIEKENINEVTVSSYKQKKTNKNGGRQMRNFEDLYSNVCHGLGIDLSVDDTEESFKALGQTVSNKLGILKESHKTLVSLQQGLAICEKYLIENDETGLKADEIVKRLPEKLRHAENGKKFLDFQKNEALKFFDMATVKPDSDMSDNDKRIRNRINSSFDLEFIEEQLSLYKEVANGRFGADKSAQTAELPKATNKTDPQITNSDEEDIDRIFGGK